MAYQITNPMRQTVRTYIRDLTTGEFRERELLPAGRPGSQLLIGDDQVSPLLLQQGKNNVLKVTKVTE